MADLRQVLADTLSPYAETRRTAENRLGEAQKSPGHPLEVLRLVASADAADAAVRQAASVHFKNLVKHGWDVKREDNHGIVISPEDRNTIKSHLVQLMCTVPHQIQAQISEAISLIAKVDYPENWTNLLPELVSQFQSTDLAVVCGVFRTAHSIFKDFRYVARSDQLYRDILYTLKIIQEPLLTVFISTGKAVEAFANDAAQLIPRMDILRSISQIFFDLNYQDLPEYFEDHMGEWMGEFAKYLQYNNPLLIDDSEETQPEPIHDLQASIVENLALFASRDEESFLPYLSQFTSAVWNLLISLTNQSKHDTLVTTSIKFLSSLVQKLMHRDLFKDDATLRQIVTQIVIPNLMIRQVDEERFEDDPRDFILTEVEGSDSESRRRCSEELLRAMCRQFEAETTAICYEHIDKMLREYATDQGNKWAAKDAAIHLMLGIAIRRESSLGVSELNDGFNLMEFFNAHVLIELRDTNHATRPMVKASCLKFVAKFRNQFTTHQLVALMPVLIAHLGSPSVVVHTFAAYTIERLLVTKESDPTGSGRTKLSGKDMKPFMENLFTGLFRIVDNEQWNENEHVMKCIMRSLACTGEDIIPITAGVFEKLTNALGRVCKNPRNPQFNHYLFESVAVLVRTVCKNNPSGIAQLESLLFPPFQTVLQMEIVEFTPYVFQVLAQLLEYRPAGSGLGDSYTGLFQPLLTPYLWERKGNVPALTRLMQAYLKAASGQLVSHLMPILGIFQKLLSTKKNEESAFELLTAITLYVPPESVSPHLKTIFQLLLTKLQAGKTPRFVRLITNYFAVLVGKYGAQAFFEALNQVQVGVALTLIVQVWTPRLNSDPPVRIEAKTQVVGLTRLLCDSPALIGDPNGKQIWANTLAAVVGLLTASSWSSVHTSHDDEVEEIEIGYDATYSVLMCGRKQVEDPFADIADPVSTFVQALHSLSTAQPGVVGPIIQEGLGADPKLSAGLQSMIQKSGLHIA